MNKHLHVGLATELECGTPQQREVEKSLLTVCEVEKVKVLCENLFWKISEISNTCMIP